MDIRLPRRLLVVGIICACEVIWQPAAQSRIVSVVAGKDQIRRAVGSLAAGDTVMLASGGGTYFETGEVDLPAIPLTLMADPSLSIRPTWIAGGKTHLEIYHNTVVKGIRFQGGETTEYAIQSKAPTPNALVVEQCEFTNLVKDAITEAGEHPLDSCVVRNSSFQDIGMSAIEFRTPDMCRRLIVENCTFTRLGEHAVHIAQEAADIDVRITNITIHNCQGGIYLNRIGDASVSNAIITGCRTYAVRSLSPATLTGICTFQNRVDYDDHAPGTACFNADPRYLDPESGDFSLLPDSPCLSAGLSGEPLGDLRWTGEATVRARQHLLVRTWAPVAGVVVLAGGVLGAFFFLIRRRVRTQEGQKAYEQMQERLAILMEHVPVGICLLDDRHCLIVANPAGREYLRVLDNITGGGPLTRLAGKPLVDLTTPREDGLAHEVSVEQPSRRFFRIEARPFRDGITKQGCMLILQEVTREREIQNRAQQQDRLAAVGQLAAGIAHDFNNLLTVVVGTAQLLEMRADIPDSAKKDLSSIFTQGQQAAELIRQILDFSRQTAAKRRPVDLVPFLKETAKLLKRTLPETIRLQTVFGPARHTVKGNLPQLQQVLTNLVLNARDAMPSGGMLTLQLSRRAFAKGEPPFPGMSDGEWVLLTVSDTGTGMSPDVLEHIYEPFFTTKKPGHGTGLGLAQVYGIVKQHQGFIDVESDIGRGSTFTVYLPVANLKDQAIQQAAKSLPTGRGETILVVEDEPEVREIACAILNGLGYQAHPAASGQEALNVYAHSKEEIALILTDVVMPDMGGLDLITALKNQRASIRVVLMSGYPVESREEIRQYEEIVGFLEKPLLMDRVAFVVARALYG